MRYPFDSEQAQTLNKHIFETIYFAALTASCELAQKDGNGLFDCVCSGCCVVVVSDGCLNVLRVYCVYLIVCICLLLCF